jgi:2'-5' RNA ligase
VAEDEWYWGAVVRVDAAQPLLTAVAACVDGERVRAQHPSTGHITLFYAPLRAADAASVLAARVREDVARVPAFDLRCTGFGEFPSPTRPVAWLGIEQGTEAITALRALLCRCDQDCHRHAFVPHLTLAYGEDPEAYAARRDDVHAATRAQAIESRVDAIWIAGFPATGHPARDLRYVERIMLADA